MSLGNVAVDRGEESVSGAVAKKPVVIVSSDTHIGPRLVEDLRPYCPKEYLGRYDHFTQQVREQQARDYQNLKDMPGIANPHRNRSSAGHYDPYARLNDLNFDGVAAEIIFHASQNEEPIPFGNARLFVPDPADVELLGVGRQIYNRWIADFITVEPERHVALVYPSMSDIEASVREVQWGREHGLRGVNFPAPRPTLKPYNDRDWEPLWSVCEDLQMPLTTHSGAGDPTAWKGRESFALMQLESGGWNSRRGLAHLIFGGVFERHPGLQLVLTEQPGDWWSYALREMDSAWLSARDMLGDQVPRPPSEYCSENVYLGGSFLARFEAEDAVAKNYSRNVLWGSDYPHQEGTWLLPEDENGPSVGRQALRRTFAGLPEPDVRSMLGENAIRVYGLDPAALAKVAERISAPTIDEIDVPLDTVPAGASRLAFREVGPWA
jgi:predicted TIM-barrel fold metal-dependent hydrolase